MSELHASGNAKSRRIIVALAIAGSVMLGACNRQYNERANQESERKMNLVLVEMIRRAKPENKSVLESGKIFVNIKNLDMPVVGVAVPNKFTGKRILVSFTAEHFQDTEIDVLAHEGLEDFERALKLSERQEAQPHKTGAN